MENIYHITTNKEWEIAKKDGFYVASSLPIEGFIHCSKEEQVDGVLDRYYKGISGLVKLVIDVTKLNHKLVYELAPSVDQEFPHIYGSINIDAVIDVVVLNQ